jgi:hypothetical protein
MINGITSNKKFLHSKGNNYQSGGTAYGMGEKNFASYLSDSG